MASWVSRITSISVGILFLVSIAYRTFLPGDDPYRCRSVLETGRWIDPPDENGDRLPFENWQPDGCLFHNYTSVEIQQCLEDRPILLSGDSTSRNLGFGIGRLLNRSQAILDREMFANRHETGNFTWDEVKIEAIWNPFLRTLGHSERESTLTFGGESLVETLQRISNARASSTSDNNRPLPPLVFFSSGAWYTRSEHAVEEKVEKYAVAISNLSELVGTQKSNFIVDPMDPYEGIRDQIFFAPPAGPWYLGNDTEAMESKSRQAQAVIALQNWLHQTTGDWNFHLVWAIPKLFVNQTKAVRDPYSTGWHAIEVVVEAKANILLNLRCNAKLDRLNGFPYNRTCCTDYGVKPAVQLSLVAISLTYLVACLVCEGWDCLAYRSSPRWTFLNTNIGTFFMALLMCYYADRTQIMAKAAKLRSSTDFGILCSISAVGALATIRRSRTSSLNPSAPVIDTNQPFLSRYQTEEWKGWMLLVILISHWTDAKLSVRTLIAAYLFLTGYEHTTFFMLKRDFSLNRVATVMLRLNLLSCSLAYFMNTTYMFYSLPPLISFWFTVVYATMAIGHKTLNMDIQLLLSKICISAALVGIMLATPLTRWTFFVLRITCGIRWSPEEWDEQVSAGILVVYFGMILAIANLKMNEALKPTLKYCLALVSIMVIYGYWYACFTEQVPLSTPHLSIIPIVAFVTIRNASPLLRNHHSKAMSWLGKYYLEAYALQFHLFLAADSYGVLLIGAFKGDGTLVDRWRSLIIIIPVFFWISSMTSSATRGLVEIILGTSPKPDTISVVPLDSLDKDATYRSSDETDGQGFHNESLFDGASTNKYLTRIRMNDSTELINSVKFIVHSPQARVGLVLLMMWLLNWLSPVPAGVSPTL